MCAGPRGGEREGRAGQRPSDFPKSARPDHLPLPVWGLLLPHWEALGTLWASVLKATLNGLPVEEPERCKLAGDWRHCFQ